MWKSRNKPEKSRRFSVFIFVDNSEVLNSKGKKSDSTEEENLFHVEKWKNLQVYGVVGSDVGGNIPYHTGHLRILLH